MAGNKKALPEAKTAKKPGLKVTAKTDGFRRGGREWVGEVEVLISEFTDDQLLQIRTEGKKGGKLVVQDIHVDVVVNETEPD